MADQIPSKAAEFHRAADHLRRLAELILAYLADHRPLAAPGSRAEYELGIHDFDDNWGKATFEVVHEVGPRLVMVADHLGGLAALSDAERVTISIASLVRPSLESLGQLDWLFEEDIDVRERVRRRYNLRLRSLAEQWNVAQDFTEPGRTQAVRSTGEAILAIRESAKRLEFDYVTPKQRYKAIAPVRYLDEPLPSDAKLIVRVAGTGGEKSARNGRMVQRITSAVIHGQAHGILPFLIDPQPTSEAGVARAAVGISMGWFAVLAGSAFLASNRVMRLLCRYYGWDAGAWDAVAQPAIADLMAWLQGSPR